MACLTHAAAHSHQARGVYVGRHIMRAARVCLVHGSLREHGSQSRLVWEHVVGGSALLSLSLSLMLRASLWDSVPDACGRGRAPVVGLAAATHWGGGGGARVCSPGSGGSWLGGHSVLRPTLSLGQLGQLGHCARVAGRQGGGHSVVVHRLHIIILLRGVPGVVWCGVVWCGVVWCGVVWCGVVRCGVPWCAVVCRGVPWCAVVCRGVPCCGVVCCAVLCCAVLCCAVLWCAVLCCAVLWCGVPKALLPKGKRPGCLPTGTGKQAGLCVLCARCV